MERIRNLTRYQKGILIALILMLILFAVVYSVVISRMGFLYQDSILVPREVNGATIYEGNIDGLPASFTVTADKAVSFRIGTKTYGPYTAKEVPSAIPEGHDMAQYMTGVELWEGDSLIFEGGAIDMDGLVLFSKDDGKSSFLIAYATLGDGTTVDMNGNPVDPMAPSPYTVLSLMEGPELTHKGYWFGWFFGLLFSGVTAVSILYVDELFEFYLSCRVQNMTNPEPTQQVVVSRYFAWTGITVLILIIYILGLQ